MTIQNPDEPITIDDVTTTAAISTPSNKSEGILGLYINYSWQAPTIKKIRSVVKNQLVVPNFYCPLSTFDDLNTIIWKSRNTLFKKWEHDTKKIKNLYCRLKAQLSLSQLKYSLCFYTVVAYVLLFL
uniref:Uncharacterized protein n=1 Tax=Rhizophagus irregularis (strain DAOM 181602 / DAOM 197198 / MUCL 43194) TaxID=747089 RepID=U9TBK2_RHIID